MPELPEVETICRGIRPHLLDQRIDQFILRQAKLRWPIPPKLRKLLPDLTISSVERRGKYILIHCQKGYLLLHMGMSGSLRILPGNQPPGKHDHWDLRLENGHCLRYHDPRRFGATLWTSDIPANHKLLARLGPEPLSDAFNTDDLWQQSRQRKVSIKAFIMNSQIVVGVGNIYASESLFMAGIHPSRAAGKISKPRLQKLTDAIKVVLQKAIEQGGTTLKDFQQQDGKPGYFAQQLLVYGRDSQPCFNCQTPIRKKVIGQRASFYCPVCQKY